VAVDLYGSGHTVLPALKPRIQIVRMRLPLSHTLHAGSYVSDPSASVAAYAAPHSIVATCNQNNVIDKANWAYYLMVQNEGGLNAVNALTIVDISLTQTITELRPQ
jgi:hypothetical protein